MVVLAMRWEGSNDIYLIGQEIEKKEKKKKKSNIMTTNRLLQIPFLEHDGGLHK